MGIINDCINYYTNILKQEPQNNQLFSNTIAEFNNSFSNYVQNNLHNQNISILETESFQFDYSNNLICFSTYQISPNMFIRPIFHLKQLNPNTIYNLNFEVKLIMNDEEETYFYYLNPFNYDNNYLTFSYLLHIIHQFLDANILNNFYQVINYCNQELYKYMGYTNDKNGFVPENKELNNEEEMSPDPGYQMLNNFVEKFNSQIHTLYSEEIIKQMENDKDIVYFNLSSFLRNNLIGKNYKYENFLQTVEHYTSIFEAVHLEKQIILSAQYYPNFTIRPVIEFSFLKNNEEINKMITIDFLKFEVSYYNKNLPYDKFDTHLTIIPYHKNEGFKSLLDLMIIFQSRDLSLFDNIENPQERLPTLSLLPFLESFCGELERIHTIMKNPTMKRNLESNFLHNNKNFNERELDKYLD